MQRGSQIWRRTKKEKLLPVLRAEAPTMQTVKDSTWLTGMQMQQIRALQLAAVLSGVMPPIRRRF
jgi:hypothetical protein